MDPLGIDRAVPANRDQSGAYGLDPRTLLEEFRSSGTFDEVATEEVDGVETRRLRASNPGEAPAFPVMHNDVPGVVTSLEI